jgi:hypothetical protein
MGMLLLVEYCPAAQQGTGLQMAGTYQWMMGPAWLVQVNGGSSSTMVVRCMSVLSAMNVCCRHSYQPLVCGTATCI